jgi:hypothetical protein
VSVSTYADDGLILFATLHENIGLCDDGQSLSDQEPDQLCVLRVGADLCQFTIHLRASNTAEEG